MSITHPMITESIRHHMARFVLNPDLLTVSCHECLGPTCMVMTKRKNRISRRKEKVFTARVLLEANDELHFGINQGMTECASGVENCGT